MGTQLSLPLVEPEVDLVARPIAPWVQIADFTVLARCACQWSQQGVVFTCAAPAAYAVHDRPICGACLRRVTGWELE